MNKAIFSTGTARSGTTFFARILSVNENLKLTNDPFLPLFRSFRTEVVRQTVDAEFDASRPLDGYYFSDQKIRMMKAVQAADLEMEFPSAQKAALDAELKARIPLGAKELIPYIDDLSGESYFELFQSGLSLLRKAHAVGDEAWCGFNDNWVIEFFPALARAFPEAYFIVIVRDPRATVASSLKLRDKEPEMVPLTYSFVHGWRKHVTFSRMLMQHPDVKNRLSIIRYEELASNPESVIAPLCEKLNVEYSDSMLNTERFRPHRGEKWTPWSNFDVPKKGIYTDSVGSWREHLSQSLIEFIEFICDPEMRLTGYQPEVYKGGLPSDGIMSFLLEDDKQTMGWRGVHDDWDIEHAFELYRKQALITAKKLLSREVIEKYFLFESVYDEVTAL